MNPIEITLSGEEVSDLINALDCLLHKSDSEYERHLKPLYAEGEWRDRAQNLINRLIAKKPLREELEF